MLLTEKNYKDIVSAAIENETPKRIEEHLLYEFNRHKNVNLKFWSYLGDATLKLIDEDRIDNFYDPISMLNNNVRIHTEQERILFILKFSGYQVEKELESRRFNKRPFKFNNLASLVIYINKKNVYPDSSRYLFIVKEINQVTAIVLDLVFKKYLLAEEELQTASNKNRDLYIRLYFASKIEEEEYHTHYEIVFTDWRKPRSPILYVFNWNLKITDFVEIYNDRFKTANVSGSILKKSFQSLELRRWRKIKKMYPQESNEYKILNDYTRFLPGLRLTEEKSIVNSFGISPDANEKIKNVISEINSLPGIRFLTTDTTASDFANAFTSSLNNKTRIKFRCETYLVVLVLNSIIKTFKNPRLTVSKICKRLIFLIPSSHKKPSNYHNEADDYFEFKPLLRPNYYNHIDRLKNWAEDKDNALTRNSINKILLKHGFKL